jgi:hypothetical protein
MAGLAAAGLSGCFKPSIEGEWKGTKAIGPVTAAVRYTFDSDKHYTSENSVSSNVGSLKTVQAGSYEIAGNTITFRQRNSTVNGVDIQRAKVLIETHRFEVHGNTLVLNMGQPDKVVLTRVK